MNKKSLVWRDPEEGDQSRPSDAPAKARRPDIDELSSTEIVPEPRKTTRVSRPAAAEPTRPAAEPTRSAAAPRRDAERPAERAAETRSAPPPRSTPPEGPPRPARRPYDEDRGPAPRYSDAGPPPRRYADGPGGPPPPRRYEDPQRPPYRGDRPYDRGPQQREPYDSRTGPPRPAPGPGRYNDRQGPPPQGYDRGQRDNYGYRGGDDRYGRPDVRPGYRPAEGPPAGPRPGQRPPDTHAGPPRPRYPERAPAGRGPARPPMGRPAPGPRAPVKGTFNREAGRDKMHQEAADFAKSFNIPEAVAFQIVRGDFTLKEWLDKHSEAERKREERNKVLAVKKQQRGRDEGMGQQYFLKQKKNGTSMRFEMYEGQSADGKIISILPYHFWLEFSNAASETEREKIEKLRCLFCYKHENGRDVVAARTVDEAVVELKIPPVREKEGRYEVPLDVVQKAADDGATVRVTLNDGSVFQGTVDWHSNYFIKLKVAANASVVVFNHAIHDLALPVSGGRRAAR